MANAEHVEILKQGVEIWNVWRKDHEDIRPDLSEAVLRYASLINANLRNSDLRSAKLDESDLSGANLGEADLSGAGLSEVNLCEANLVKANLSEANLADANFRCASLTGALLTKAYLACADFSGADLIGANLTEAILGGANLSQANLNEADLSNAKLKEANLDGANLSKVNLSKADLREASLNGAKLPGADCREANMHKAKLVDVNLRDADLRRAHAHEADLSQADLLGGDFSMANFSRTDFRGANLRGTKLDHADLRRSILHCVDLRFTSLNNTDLRHAGLSCAILSESDLIGIDLGGAELGGAYLSGADLSHANLAEAKLIETSLSNVNLSDANLFQARLQGTDLSRANLSRAYLRECTMVQVDLDGAIVEDAVVEEFRPTSLTGYPITPKRLYVNEERTKFLEGAEAARFFQSLAVVQVVVSGEFEEYEEWGYRGVAVELHRHGMGSGVNFVRPIKKDGKTILEFEGQSYDAIYSVLPELLQAFPSSGAIRYGELLPMLLARDTEDSDLYDVERVLKELKPKQLVWANQLATRIRTFCDTLALEILEPNTGRTFEVYEKFTDKSRAQRTINLNVTNFGKLAIAPEGVLDMGDTYSNTGDGNVVAQGVGANTNAGDIAVNSYNGDVSGIDGAALVEELGTLFQAMRSKNDEAEHLADQTVVVEAKKAAEAGDLAGAMGRLKAMGKWGWDVVTKVGTGVALAAVRDKLGL